MRPGAPSATDAQARGRWRLENVGEVVSSPVSREVTLRELLEAMAHLPDDTPFRWFQVTASTTAGWASPGDSLLVTLGQVRAALSSASGGGQA